jgi:hypothetical protein
MIETHALPRRCGELLAVDRQAPRSVALAAGGAGTVAFDRMRI